MIIGFVQEANVEIGEGAGRQDVHSTFKHT